VIDNGGVQLGLTATGDGPDVLFAHGLGSAQEMWDDIVAGLKERYTCWTLDFRGHGASDHTPGGYSPQSYASDVEAALAHIGRPTLGVGHSLGGGTLTRVAAGNHALLSGVFAIDSSIIRPVGARSKSAGVFERILNMLEEYRAANRPAADYVAWLAAMPYVNAVPFRILAADPDLGSSVRPEHDETLAALTPHVEIRRLSGVGHPIPLVRDYDAVVLADLEEWLSRTSV